MYEYQRPKLRRGPAVWLRRMFARDEVGYLEASDAPPPTEPAEPIEPEPPAPNSRFELRSRDERFAFEVNLAVCCLSPNGNAANDEAFQRARRAIRDRAVGRLSRRFSLTQPEHCQAALTAVLRDRQSVSRDEPLLAWAESIEVFANPLDRQRVERIEQIQRQSEIDEARWAVTNRQIDRLTELISDPTRATAWWLSSRMAEVDSLPASDTEKLVAVADLFQEVSARLRDHALHDEATVAHWPQAPHDGMSQVIAEFEHSADPADRERLIDLMSKYLENLDMPELGDRLRQLSLHDHDTAFPETLDDSPPHNQS